MSQADVLEFLSSHKGKWFDTMSIRELACEGVSIRALSVKLQKLNRFGFIKKREIAVQKGKYPRGKPYTMEYCLK